MRAFKLLLLVLTVLPGCTSVQGPLIASAPNIDVPVVADTKMFADVNVEVTDNGEWWVVDNRETRLFGWRDRILYDDTCRPNVSVLATVAEPAPHPFIREDLVEAERARLLGDRAAGVHVVLFDLAPVTLDEVEEEFIEHALPRAKPKDPSYSCYGWPY